jgi:hypothetical protein
MMPMPVRRKARKMEKVKNFCRTATAKHVIPARGDHAVESEMSGGFKISREGGHWPRGAGASGTIEGVLLFWWLTRHAGQAS